LIFISVLRIRSHPLGVRDDNSATFIRQKLRYRPTIFLVWAVLFLRPLDTYLNVHKGPQYAPEPVFEIRVPLGLWKMAIMKLWGWDV
jgi:hypothetical protein